MKYTIEFELPDNETVLQGIKNEYVKWAGWGYSGLSKAKPVSMKKQKEQKCRECGEATSKAIQELQTKLKAQEPVEARLNLCESCTKEYPECDATVDGMEFGCGVGNDNIIGCTAYVNQWKAQEPVKPLKMAVDHVRKEPIVFSYECPVCMCGLQRHWVACPICGTGVKWE